MSQKTKSRPDETSAHKETSAAVSQDATPKIASRFRRGRELAGLSIEQAARTIGMGMTVRRLAAIEANQARATLPEIEEMMLHYDCSVFWLLGDQTVVDPKARRAIRQSTLSTADQAMLLELLESRSDEVRGRKSYQAYMRGFAHGATGDPCSTTDPDLICYRDGYQAGNRARLEAGEVAKQRCNYSDRRL